MKEELINGGDFVCGINKDCTFFERDRIVVFMEWDRQLTRVSIKSVHEKTTWKLVFEDLLNQKEKPVLRECN